MQTVGLAVAAVVATVLVLMVLMRRQSRQQALIDVTRSLQSQEAMARMAPADFAGAEAAASDQGLPDEFVRLTREREGLRQKAVGLASSEPEAAAQLIRAWMVKKKSLQGAGADVG
jgi:flagellar biosynthesis/type III secretory pathway M-ring protein FliF/YscJ